MSFISAGNTTTTTLVVNGDTTGNLVFNTGGANTTALTITNAQNATFANVVTATGGFVVGASAAPAFSAYLSGSNQSVSLNTWTKVQLNVESFDTNNNFDSTTNYRFTPTVAGYYQFNAAILYSFSSGTSGVTLVGIYKNGGVYLQNECTATVTNGHSVLSSSLIYMNGTTDYVEMWGYVGNATAAFQSGIANTAFNGFLARSA